MTREIIMNVFPSHDENSRLVIAEETGEDGSCRLVLRQESRAGTVGWFVQSRVTVMPEQVPGLKMALTAKHSIPQPRPQADSQARPAIISFQDARSAMVG